MPQPAILAAIRCGPLVPQSYRTPVEGTPLLRGTIVTGDLANALDDQTGRLDQANGRTSDVIAIVEACDQRSAEIVKAVTPARPWWKFWASAPAP